MSIKSVGQLMGKQGRTWNNLMVLFLIPCEIRGLANKATQALSSKQSKTSPLPGPLQSSLQSYNLCGSTWNEYKSLSLSLPSVNIKNIQPTE